MRDASRGTQYRPANVGPEVFAKEGAARSLFDDRAPVSRDRSAPVHDMRDCTKRDAKFLGKLFLRAEVLADGFKC